MKTRNRKTKLLAMTLALGVLATIGAVWGARPAQAIVIIGGKTGLFTLTQGEAARIHVVNTSVGQDFIIDNGKVLDDAGNTLAEFPARRLEPGQGESFEYMPRLADGVQQKVRVELRFEGGTGRGKGLHCIPTAEVFDTGTGKTSVGQDFIIDHGIIDNG